MPNWADASIGFDPQAGKRFRARLGLEEAEPLALYSGNLGKKQGLEIMPQVAASLPQVQFVICGEGAVRRELEGACADLGNVRFLPLQAQEELAGMLSAADVHLVLQRRGAADLVLPSKLTNILAVGGRSVITADSDTELGRLAEASPAMAVLAPPEDCEALAAAILAVLQRGRLEGRCSEIGRHYAAEHLSCEAVMKGFERRLFDGCVQTPSR